MSIRGCRSVLVPAMLVPVVLGAALAVIRPRDAWLAVAAMSILPAAWLLRKRMEEGRRGSAKVVHPSRDETTALAFICASCVIALPLAAKLAQVFEFAAPWLDHSIATRWPNLLGAGYFIFLGNRLPKVLIPLADVACDPATMQTIRRRTGAGYMLTGIALAGVWLFLPPRGAEIVGIGLIGCGILVPTILMRAGIKSPKRRAGA
jgi:hypothetical protein